jgi:hypothetical protein
MRESGALLQCEKPAKAFFLLAGRSAISAVQEDPVAARDEVGDRVDAVDRIVEQEDIVAAASRRRP